MSVMRMPTKTVARLLFPFAASFALLLAFALVQESPKSSRLTSTRYFPQDVRLLSAEEINSRTLALAAEINESAK